MFGITSDMLYNFLVKALVLCTAMPVHECAHGLVADRLGDNTPRMQGRLTLNPFAHLDWTGSLLLFFTGFGWARPVEVDTRNFKSPRRDMALTALAGPASNILMSIVMLIAYKLLLGVLPTMRTSVAMNSFMMILAQIISINVRLAVFNFLPIPPLDGSKIFGVLLPKNLYTGMMRNQQYISIVFIFLLIFGILTVPLTWLSVYVYYFLDFVTSPIDAILYR